jgi:hypothetical protein
MKREIKRYTPFEAAVLTAQAGNTEPRCHMADKVHNFAEVAIRKYGRYGKTVYGQKVVRTPDYKTAIGDQDVDLQLMWPKKFGDLHPFIEPWKLLVGAFGRRAITLAINNDIALAAAIILPPRGERMPSATVLVDGEVNNAEHLEAILPIVHDMYLGTFERP